MRFGLGLAMIAAVVAAMIFVGGAKAFAERLASSHAPQSRSHAGDIAP